MEEGIIAKKYEPIPKADKATTDSDTVIKMKIAEKQLTGKKGISFYCSKRHSYIYIENERGQSNHYTPIFSRLETIRKEIPPNIMTKEWED